MVDRRVLSACALLALAAVNLAAQSGDSAKRGLYNVHGSVFDEGRVPVPDAEVSVETSTGIVRVARTGTDGLFEFGDVAGGKLTWWVKRIGYAPANGVVDLPLAGGSPGLLIKLAATPNTLTHVVVLGQDSRLRQFYERKNVHSSGVFITHDDIEKQRPHYPSDIFRRIPGASVRSARFGSTIRLRGGCRPKVWMDGIPMRDVELDDLTTPGQIAALEVYPSSAGVPPEYMDVAPRPCGVILVWTRVD